MDQSMIQFSNSRVAQAGVGTQSAPEAAELIDLDRLLAALRRQFWIIVAGAVLGIMIGAAFVVTAVPLFRASTDILIDRSQSKVVTEISGPSSVLNDDADMASQVELLRSQQMARTVVTAMKLTENSEFMAGNPSIFGSAVQGVKSLIGGVRDWVLPTKLLGEVDKAAAVASAMEVAVDILQANVSVGRVPTTYVINLDFTSPDAAIAAAVTRAYGEAYLDDQLQAKFEATKRASSWLQTRIAELKQQSYDADLAVQRFRMDNGLITAGGQLVSEQQLSEINTQLITAQSATAESKARVDQINSLIASGRTDAVVDDSLASSTINALRSKYLDAAKREAEIRAKLGPDHVQVVRLRAEMQQYEKQIFDELRRIAESYESTYKVAASREQSLRNSLSSILGVNATANTTQVKLRELEREADTFRSLYDNFLQRYQETVQQQSFPVTEARIITEASAPANPSFPKKSLILPLFMLIGAAAGSGFAAFREYRDRFFRIGNQVRSELNVEFLGYIPVVNSGRLRADRITAAEGEPGGNLWRPDSTSGHVRYHPLSPFAETLRNVKVAADMGMPEQKSKVIGIVSSLPSEGKSTISANLGILLAMQGARVLLIDGDLRNPGLTRTLATMPEVGLIEAVLGSTDFASTVQWDSSGMLAFMPTVLKRRISHTSELLSSPSMAKMLAEQKVHFDYIIVDLPPIGPVVDAKAFAQRVDAFLFVVEWGGTPRHVVRNMLNLNPVIQEKTLGVVLNKSDESKMKFYRAHGAVDYSSALYKGYYHS